LLVVVEEEVIMFHQILLDQVVALVDI